jgi:hypothetical protein
VALRIAQRPSCKPKPPANCPERGDEDEQRGKNMNFLFQKGQRVKVKDTGKIGRVEYCSTDPTTDIPFYQIRLDDGTNVKKAESDLLPAA